MYTHTKYRKRGIKMKKYYVALEVIYPTIVEATCEEEAIQIAINSCPYDNEPSCEPFVEEMKEESEV